MVVGQHHGVSPQYLHQYANEAAGKEKSSRRQRRCLHDDARRGAELAGQPGVEGILAAGVIDAADLAGPAWPGVLLFYVSKCQCALAATLTDSEIAKWRLFDNPTIEGLGRSHY
jgi:hypothetical protein